MIANDTLLQKCKTLKLNVDKEYLVIQLLSKILYQTIFVKSASLVDNFGVLIHRELKLDGAIGDFAEPL